MKRFITALCLIAILLVGSWIAAVVQAVDVDLTIGGTIGYPAKDRGKIFLLSRTVDFSSSVITGTAANVYQIFNIPAGTWVMNVGLEVETGEDGTCTVDIGDGSDPNGYMDNTNIETGATATATAAWTLGSTAVAYMTNVVNTTTTITYTTNIADTVTAFMTNLVQNTVSLTNMTLHGAAATIAVLTNVVIQTANAVISTAPETTTVTVTTNTTVQRATAAYPISAAMPYAAGKLYTTTDTLDVLLNNNADAAKITVRALCVPIAGLD